MKITVNSKVEGTAFFLQCLESAAFVFFLLLSMMWKVQRILCFIIGYSILKCSMVVGFSSDYSNGYTSKTCTENQTID